MLTPHVIDVGQARQLVLEPVRCGGQNRGLGVGFAGEGHAGELAADRARTVCGNQVAGVDGFGA